MESVQKTGQDVVELENWVDEAVMSFIIDMKYKLRLNNHKGHWKEYDNKFLQKRLKDEMAELGEVLQRLADHSPSSHLYLDIIRECADVSNFAMMIADNAKREMRKLDEHFSE